MRKLRLLTAPCALALILTAMPAQAEPSAALIRGYDLAYNLDHDEAMAAFSRIIEERPDDPAGYRSVAATVWLRFLFLRGGMLVDNYMAGSVNKATVKVDKPPDALDELFHRHIARAVALSEQAVKDAPDDPDAHYNLGASVALEASYRASIEGKPLNALRDAKRAYEAHEKVLELDPSRKDASLIIGIYRYIVSIMPRAFRMMAYLVGFDGGKEEALAMIREAAAYPGESQTEAKFALVLLYNREKEFVAAQRVLNDLKGRYPDNRLVWLESASTHIRNDRPLRAERALRQGFAKLERDTRTRMYGEEVTWRLKRGMALVALDRPGDALPDLLKRFSNRPCTTWGGRGTSARTDAGGPMRAYAMDLRERALLDSDAGMKAADVAAKYRVSGSWVRLLKQRRRDTGEVAPRVQRQGRRGMREPHLHTVAALMAAHPDRTLAERKDALATPASVPPVWRAVRALGLTVQNNGPPGRTRSA